MPVIERYTKQLVDDKDYDVHYDEWFANAPGDTLNDATAVVRQTTGEEGPMLEVYRIELTAQVAKLWVKGGTHGAKYLVELTVQTQQGRTDQCELMFTVKET